MARNRDASKIEAWMMALRIRTLPIPTIQVLAAVGTAYALTGKFYIGIAFCTWLIAVLITVGTNLINDLFDFEKGGDPLVRFGQTKVLRVGLLSQAEVRAGGLMALGLPILLSLFLSSYAGWTISALVLLSALMGYCYTGGPYPICYLGLSELFILIFYGGVCVLTAYYLQTGALAPEAILLAVQLGLLAIIPNAVNNFRDIYEDAEVHKRTLAVRFGKTFARWEISLLLLLPFVLNSGWLLLGHPLAFFAPIPLLPLAIVFICSICKNDPGPHFVRYFKLSVLLHFLFGSLVTAGLTINQLFW